MSTPDDERVIAFYLERGTDHRGRKLSDIWRLGLTDLELSHDYIQWLFPLNEPSRAQPESPVLSAAGADAMKKSPEIQAHLVSSVKTMARFYGFELTNTANSLTVLPGHDLGARASVWISPGNHNYLRQTRILKSTALLGLQEVSREWFACLSRVYESHRKAIGETTFKFWKAAAG
jgi:Opioid growth factor receptor (OGFr) conserved region